MKRSLAVLLSAIMLLSLCACGGETSTKTEKKSLYEHGLDVIAVMSEMTQLESYVETYTGSGEIKEIVQTIGEEDYTTPKAVYAITASAEQIAAYAGVDALSDASNELQKTMENKFIVALISQVNGMAGAMNLAAASVCTSGKTFVSDEISESVIYLYTFDDARPISVTFTCGEDNTVSASGMFMMNDEFPCDSVAEIEEFFGEVGVNVSEVKNLPFTVFTMLFSSFNPNTHMGILLSLANMEAVMSTT